MHSANTYVTVTGVERHMDRSMTDLHGRDCYIKAVSSSKERVFGYGPSSFCSSVKVGDKVLIEDGVVTKK